MPLAGLCDVQSRCKIKECIDLVANSAEVVPSRPSDSRS